MFDLVIIKALVFALFVAVAVARPQGDKDTQIVKLENENLGDGQYNFK